VSQIPDPAEMIAVRAPRRPLARYGPLAALVAVAFAAYWAGLPQMLTPEALAREQDQLHAVVAAAPAVALTAFVLGYAVVVATCIPVALMLSLIGGLVFGPWMGSAAVLLGATGAALITYAAARSAFAPSLIARAERDPRLGRLLQGFGRNAFSYIVTTRLIPFMPFGLVNIAAGLAAVPVRAYAAATLVGGAPAAIIYANLGAGLGGSLGSEASLRAALHSPQLLLPLLGLAVLSLAPTVARRLSRRGGASL
jgi:uncharacterized membrane protein YdjX (TVP38/TMEM64 family)